jgi:hypothetical protein
MSEKIQKLILLAIGVLAMSLAIGYFVFAWVEPTAPPPQGNVPAPINVGNASQTKAGRLGIGFLDTGYYLSVGTTTAGVNAGLKITNPGSQPSLYVEDSPGDATPFVIDADGIIRTPYTYSPKIGDVNRDGFVNYEDFTYVIMSYGCSSSTPSCWNEQIGADGITNPLYKKDADVNHDGKVDLHDIVTVTGCYEYFNYFTSKGYGSSFPAAMFVGLSSFPTSPAFEVVDDNYSPLLYILNNGNVGIGTTTPAYKLDVVGGYVRSDTGFCIGSSCITSWPSGGGGEAYWKLSGSNLYASSTAWNVGIGTTTPAYKLDVKGDSRVTGTLRKEGGGDLIIKDQHGVSEREAQFYNIDGTLYIRSDLNSDVDYAGNINFQNGRLFIKSDGNVGIGTTTPKDKLHIEDGVLRLGSIGTNEGGQLTLMDADDQGGWEIDNYGSAGNEVLRVGFRDKGYNNVASVITVKNDSSVDISGNLNVGGKLRVVTSGNPFTFFCGSFEANVWKSATISYGTTFSSKPIVLVTIEDGTISPSNTGNDWYLHNVNTSNFTVYVYCPVGHTESYYVHWLAIGL